MIPRINMSKKALGMAQRDHTTELVGALAGDDVKPNDFSDVRAIAMRDIRVDREQARSLGITLDVLRNPESVTDPDLRAKVDAILGLAETLGTIGQQTAIEVFQEGSRFTLVSGERRYWAALHLGLLTLNAKVLPERPQRLRLKQYVENAQREGLSTRETLNALSHVMEECAILGMPVVSFSDLKRQTGLPKATASRWWSVLSGPKDVRDAIVEGRIQSLQVADTVTQVADAAERARLIAQFAEAEKRGELMAVVESISKKGRVPKSKGGRPAKLQISFKVGSGKTEVMREILSRLLGRAPDGVDLRNPKSVMKAIESAVAMLEQEFG